MGDIFISYSHKDTENFVYEFAQRLMRYGYNLWWDTLSIRGGQRWEDEIRKGIEACTYFLPVISKESAKSEWVGKEIRLARKADRTIIPIILEGGDLKAMPGGIHADQGVRFTDDTDFDTSFNTLIDYLSKLHPQHNRLTYDNLPDLFRDGSNVTFGGVERDWIATKSYGNGVNSEVGLLVGDSPLRANAYIVAARSAPISPPETIQVFLHFTGSVESNIFGEYLDYMRTTKMPLWTLYIQGPYTRSARDGEEFRLPEEGKLSDIERSWRTSADFVLNMIERVRFRKRHLAFFLYSPNPLPMILAAKRGFSLPHDIYHHRHHERVAKKYYVRVYSTG